MNGSHALNINRDIIGGKEACAAIGVIFFVIATALGAYVRIPVYGSPVPITLQTFFVVLSGAVLGRRLGALSQTAYIMLGACGLPVFQGYSSGIAHIFGPTGGYLAGFAFAAYIAGRLTGFKNQGIWSVIASFVAGNIVLYSFGVLWLTGLYRISIVNAVSIGVLPFIPGEVVKVLLAAIIYSRIAKRSKQVFSV